MTYPTYGNKKTFLDACFEVKAEQDRASNNSNSRDQQQRQAAQMANRVENMRNSGASYAEIARRLGISESQVSNYLNS
jgi:DNA-binding CsgD family transcriptional regulator